MDVYGDKHFLFLTLISKSVDQGYINFEDIDKFTVIHFHLPRLLFGDKY